MKRTIHHEKDALLNVMTLELTQDSKTEPHFNKDRDEVIFILEGKIVIHFDYGKSVHISSSDKDPWYLIKANTTHQIICETANVRLLEAIGGIHTPDCCVASTFKV